MDDPELRPHPDALFEAAEELFAYGMALLKRVQRVPSGDVLSDLLLAGSLKGLPAETLIQAYWFPLAAGAFDTTASTIAGGVQALLQFPEELNSIREDPSLIPLAIDEMLRWVSPTVYFRRTATMETDFNGYRIKKGDKIVLCYASANRDEDVFAHPEMFDVKRTPNPHVAFGYGTHFCLGSRLATLILRIFLEEFLPLISRIQISGQVMRTRSGWMNRIKSMPVTLLPVAMAPGD
jgi:cholest-4-en-3-one 26-monooxygenase